MRRTVIALFLAVAGCAGKEAPAASNGAAAARAAIDSLDENVQRWMAAGAVDSIVTGYYASDAIVMNPNAPASVGSEAIRRSWADVSKAGLVRLRFKIARFYVSDSLASDQGTYTFQIRPKPPADTANFIVNDHGNYATTYLRRNGQWRAVFDIATSEVPLVAAPPPAKH
jgi:ketosteroid isomerase-like protein